VSGSDLEEIPITFFLRCSAKSWLQRTCEGGYVGDPGKILQRKGLRVKLFQNKDLLANFDAVTTSTGVCSLEAANNTSMNCDLFGFLSKGCSSHGMCFDLWKSAHLEVTDSDFEWVRRIGSRSSHSIEAQVKIPTRSGPF